MPPRHNYWTIILGNQATAFRAATQEELLPTLKQLQAKHPDAVMMWFASGRLWKSEEEARRTREARWSKDRPRGPRPEWRERPPGDRPGGGKPASQPKPEWKDRPRGPKPEWRDRPPADARKPFKPGFGEAPPRRDPREKPAWQPGGRKPFKPNVDGAAPPKRREGGDWRDRPAGDPPPWQNRGPKPAWKDRPMGDRPRGPKPEWRDRPQGDRPRGPKPEWRDRSQGDRPAGGKPPWKDRPPAYARKPFTPGDSGPNRREGGSGQTDRPRGPKPPWRDRPQGDRPSGGKPAWHPASARKPFKPGFGEAAPPAAPKSRSDEGGKPRSGEGGPAQDPDKRGRDWRPGGQHKDPRDRFKVPRDVKRARFKDKLRRDRTNPKPAAPKRDREGGPPKKKDEE